MSTAYLVLAITCLTLGCILVALGLPGLELAAFLGLPFLLLWFVRRAYDRRERHALELHEARVEPTATWRQQSEYTAPARRATRTASAGTSCAVTCR